jgi:hypothetical protein
MSATARAWAEENLPVEDAEALTEHAEEAGCGGAENARRSGTLALAAPEWAYPGSRPVVRRATSWNVLTDELVSFPRLATAARLDLLSEVQREKQRLKQRESQHQHGTGREAAGHMSPQAYAESWLDRERAILRTLADAGYPALARAAIGASEHLPVGTDGRRSDGRERQGLLAETSMVPLRRRDRDARAAARLRPRASAIKPRGLRRLLPGVATLAGLVGLWVGAALLATASQGPLTVLPGSVSTPRGYVYVARPGDTLWSIASRVEPGRDPMALVDQLESQIHGATLQPGMRLLLP